MIGAKNQNGMKTMEKKKRNTIILLAAVLIIAAGGVILQQTVLKRPGVCAIVQVDGEEIARLDLAKDTVLTVGDGKKDYNIIEIKEGYAAVVEADCADHICVRTGKVQNQGDVIACLPHGLIVYIECGEDGEEADMVAK